MPHGNAWQGVCVCACADRTLLLLLARLSLLLLLARLLLLLLLLQWDAEVRDRALGLVEDFGRGLPMPAYKEAYESLLVSPGCCLISGYLFVSRALLMQAMGFSLPQWPLLYQWGFQYQREWGERGQRDLTEWPGAACQTPR